ncbi:hypothetical protein HN865_00570 [Candidatus Woesearchaeota archaeon]|nr:hypothetical protein [Candidatus Woesearchaeota archaeon]MBT7237333.1 hypothetical protein [Candidatus Woesearchaeota archaeon]
MEYRHPCGLLEEQSTLEFSTTEDPIPCIYNDLCNIEGVPYNYECTQEEGCPVDCQEFYHMLQSKLKGIENGANILEKIVDKMKKEREKEGKLKLEDEIQLKSIQDMPERS